MITHKTLEGYPTAVETETADPLKFIEKPVQYLIPAATEKSIHKGNADRI